MDRLIDALISGDLNTTSLLLLFIIGILTKRFVPWWVHEEALEKLEEYEKSAPELVETINTFVDLLDDPVVIDALRRKDTPAMVPRVTADTTQLRRVARRHQRRLNHNGKGRK